jgi:hypothetical protein
VIKLSSSSTRQSIATLNASALTSGIDPRNRQGDSQSIRLCATEVTTKIEARRAKLRQLDTRTSVEEIIMVTRTTHTGCEVAWRGRLPAHTHCRPPLSYTPLRSHTGVYSGNRLPDFWGRYHSLRYLHSKSRLTAALMKMSGNDLPPPDHFWFGTDVFRI